MGHDATLLLLLPIIVFVYLGKGFGVIPNIEGLPHRLAEIFRRFRRFGCITAFLTLCGFRLSLLLYS
jgi:hypothetical protein